MTSHNKMKPYIYTIVCMIVFSFIIMFTDMKFLMYCKNFDFTNSFHDDLSPSIPVVYVHYKTSALPRYLLDAIDISVSYGNEVTLITQPVNTKDYNTFSTVNIWHYYENPITFRYRILYQKLFVQIQSFVDAEYEYNNMERFFILRDYMKSKNISKIFYVDSDVVLLTRIRQSLFLPSCNTYLSYETELNSFSRLHWVVWAGVGMLEYKTLVEFLEFSYLLLANEKYWPLLALKDNKAPFVCDMTMWYLFAGEYDNALRVEWQWPVSINESIPSISNKGKICNINELGFDHRRGYQSCKPTYSYHFQGNEKNGISHLKSKLIKKHNQIHQKKTMNP